MSNMRPALSRSSPSMPRVRAICSAAPMPLLAGFSYTKSAPVSPMTPPSSLSSSSSLSPLPPSLSPASRLGLRGIALAPPSAVSRSRFSPCARICLYACEGSSDSSASSLARTALQNSPVSENSSCVSSVASTAPSCAMPLGTAFAHRSAASSCSRSRCAAKSSLRRSADILPSRRARESAAYSSASTSALSSALSAVLAEEAPAPFALVAAGKAPAAAGMWPPPSAPFSPLARGAASALRWAPSAISTSPSPSPRSRACALCSATSRARSKRSARSARAAAAALSRSRIF
mmetsp:Transcript_22934/g.50165  ORF Transcript_22934/g.50165 Transcript_22934/m.50165 type:complete len:291 (-) Transcript_22934:1174-2046(-)